MTAGRRRVLAQLQVVTEVETPYGGQARSREPLGAVWLAPERVTARRRDGAAGERRMEVRRATTLVDGRLVTGRVLEFEGALWRIASVRVGALETELELEREP